MMEAAVLQCPSLADHRRCWHTGKEEEGSYHGSAGGNGSEGKKKVKRCGVWPGVRVKGKLFSCVIFKKKRNSGTISFELDMES